MYCRFRSLTSTETPCGWRGKRVPVQSASTAHQPQPSGLETKHSKAPGRGCISCITFVEVKAALETLSATEAVRNACRAAITRHLAAARAPPSGWSVWLALRVNRTPPSPLRRHHQLPGRYLDATLTLPCLESVVSACVRGAAEQSTCPAR